MTVSEQTKYTNIKDGPLVIHNYKTSYHWGPQRNPSSGLGFKLRGANCPKYTTPECAKCDEWIEFTDQTGGPIGGCNPLEKCIDCELREPCPCFDEERIPQSRYGQTSCACGCGQEFRKVASTHKYATLNCGTRHRKILREQEGRALIEVMKGGEKSES